MKFLAWQLMWTATGVAVIGVALMFCESAFGNPGTLANAMIGGAAVVASQITGTFVKDWFGWPRWLD